MSTKPKKYCDIVGSSPKKYCDVGPYPTLGGKPLPPQAFHGGMMFLSDVVTGVALCYRDFPVTEFIEVCWSIE